MKSRPVEHADPEKGHVYTSSCSKYPYESSNLSQILKLNNF